MNSRALEVIAWLKSNGVYVFLSATPGKITWMSLKRPENFDEVQTVILKNKPVLLHHLRTGYRTLDEMLTTL